MKGETNYCIGALNYDIKREEKIGYVSDRKNVYVYSVEEYDDSFLYVHGRMEPGMVTGEIYVRSGVEKIPWCFAEAGMPLKRNQIIFNDVAYYLFSSSPKEFQIGKEIGSASQNGMEYQVYEIPNMNSESWITIRHSDNEPYLIYWSENIKEVSWEYFEMQRKYPGIEFFEDNLNLE